MYDLPATVDKILAESGAEDLFYVGHSQGGAIAYAGMSKNRTLASKIKMFAPLAPAVYVKDMISPLRKLVPYTKDIVVSSSRVWPVFKQNLVTAVPANCLINFHSSLISLKCRA